MDLRGKNALITGAARRVGRAIAMRLAQSGCNVCLHFHRSREEADETARACQALGVKAVCLPADLAEPVACRKLVANYFEHHNGLDVLINNASLFEPMRLDAFDVAAWNRTLQVNLTAPMILVHAARDALRTSRGRVVNLCDAAVARPWPDHLAYIVSKGALETLTKALARALAPEVNVVGVAPGVADWPDQYDVATRQRLTRKIPLRRPGTPDDIASAVHYLVTEGDYVTGAILTVDGGRAVV